MASSRNPHPPARAPSARVVLSGPLGSGKSTVGAVLVDLGAEVIDADRIGHQVYAPGAEAHDAVARRWPQVVAGGEIDRKALAAIVFADPSELEELEAITHPHIARRIDDAVAASTGPVVVVELPLAEHFLGEGWHHLAVLAPEETRFRRAVARGMDPDDVRLRMRAQPSNEVWEQSADEVIHNDGDIDSLRRQVEAWWSRFADEAANRAQP